MNIQNRIYRYSADLININDLGFEDIVLDKQSSEDIVIYNLEYKIPYSV